MTRFLRKPILIAAAFSLCAVAGSSPALAKDRTEAFKQTAEGLGLCIRHINDRRALTKAMIEAGWRVETWNSYKLFTRNSWENVVTHSTNGAGLSCGSGAVKLPEALAKAQVASLVESMGGKWGRVPDVRGGDALGTLLPSKQALVISVHPDVYVGDGRYTFIDYVVTEKTYEAKDVFK